LRRKVNVLENIIVGAERPGNEVAVGSAGVEQHALAGLDFVRLAELRMQTVQSLSYGHQRLAEIARALAGNPKLLLLDEPGAGLNKRSVSRRPVLGRTGGMSISSATESLLSVAVRLAERRLAC